MIAFKHRGDLRKTDQFLTRAQRIQYRDILNRYGREGARVLAIATPVDSGKTAESWDFKVEIFKDKFSVSWTNSNVVDGVPIAILLQYGHGTRNGGYVRGQDYINPALRPILDKLAQEAWKEITSL